MGCAPIFNLTAGQSVNQRSSSFHTKLLVNVMSVDLYGSLAQTELVRYFFVRETSTSQGCDLLFAIGQSHNALVVFAIVLVHRLGLYVTKPVRPQGK
jgi:hypothetical protein